MDLPKTPDDLYHYERLVRAAGLARVIGIDEAGRGPLAGPVVVAAVLLPPGRRLAGLNDSKQLSEKRRKTLYAEIDADPAIEKAVIVVPPAIIDRLNIYQATVHGMYLAAKAIAPIADFALVDGKPVNGLPCPSRGIVKGDAKCAAIAAASILAKVTRDRIMHAYHADYPAYGFDRHKGYPTAAHVAALAIHGISPIHRRTFGPVKALLPDHAPVQTDLELR